MVLAEFILPLVVSASATDQPTRPVISARRSSKRHGVTPSLRFRREWTGSRWLAE